MNDISIKQNQELSQPEPIKIPALVDKYFNSSLLNKNDVIKLHNAQDFMVNTYESVPMYRPLIIKLFGVLSSTEFPSTDSRFLQCKIEAEVHSNELIKDLHDLQLLKIKIEKAEYLLSEVMIKKYQKETDEISKKEIEFDIREQEVIISNKKFDYAILQKRIKYRISEIDEWKMIAEKLFNSTDFKNKKHNEILLDIFINNYNKKLNDPNIKEEEKLYIRQQLEIIKDLKTNNGN